MKRKYQFYDQLCDSFGATSSVNMASEVEMSESNILSRVTSREAILNNIRREGLKSYINIILSNF